MGGLKSAEPALGNLDPFYTTVWEVDTAPHVSYILKKCKVELFLIHSPHLTFRVRLLIPCPTFYILGKTKVKSCAFHLIFQVNWEFSVKKKKTTLSFGWFWEWEKTIHYTSLSDTLLETCPMENSIAESSTTSPRWSFISNTKVTKNYKLTSPPVKQISAWP